MTRMVSRSCSLCVVVLTVVIIVIAAGVLDQNSAAQSLGKAHSATFSSASNQAEAQKILSRAASGQAARSDLSSEQGTSPTSPLFVVAAAYYSGALTATAIAVGDLNGDGQPDLAVTNQCLSSDCPLGGVSVLLGNSDGTFQTPVTYQTNGFHPWSVAIGDVNGDSYPDLVVGNFIGGIAVLLSNGNGTFRAPVLYDTGAYAAFSVAIGDLNNDGHPDLAVSSWCAHGDCSHGGIDVMLGNGDGSFQAPLSFDSGGQYTYTAEIADINGDGRLDLIASNNVPGSISVLLGNGDGTFQTPVIYSAGGTGSARLDIADLNGDGHLDVVVGNYSRCPSCSDAGVGVLLGNGDGTFQPAISYSSGGTKGFSVVVGDLNEDGYPDLVVTNVNTHSIGVLLGNGDGTFQPVTLFDSGGFCDFSVAIADVNRDSHPDLLVTNFCAQYCEGNIGPGAVGVLLNNTLGQNLPTTTTLSSSPNPSIFGQPVVFTSQVTSGAGTPEGIVIAFDGSTPVANGQLVNGTTSTSSSSLSAGSHSIVGKYEGSLKFSLSTSSTSQVVNKATTASSVVSSLNPAPVHKLVTFTARVTSQYGGVVSGSLTFRDGASTLATVRLSGNQAAYSSSSLSQGAHSITATYWGDANNNGSTSAALTEYVTGASKTVLTTSGSPTLLGQSVTFTATVTSMLGTIPDGELVTFYDGKNGLASVALAGGKAAYTTSALAPKTHAIKATYVGDTTFSPSTGMVSQVVLKYPTTTFLSSNLNPSTYGQPVTFTATVAPTGSYPITGQVRFFDGSTAIGTATVSGGLAKIVKSTLAVGTHAITAKYLSNAYNAQSTSAVVNQLVQ